MLLRACSCYHSPCRHNPPKGQIAVTRKNHSGYWFVNKNMSWFEKFFRKYFKGYNL